MMDYQSFEAGQFNSISFDQVGQFMEQMAPSGRIHSAPFWAKFECIRSSLSICVEWILNSGFDLYLHSHFHISLVAFLYIGNFLFGCWIKCSKSFATFRIVPFIVYENLNYVNTFYLFYSITLVYFGSSFHTGFGAGTAICRIIEVLEFWRRRKDAEIERQYILFSKF